MKLILKIQKVYKLILILLCGANSFKDIEDLVTSIKKTVGCSAGSLFVFKVKFDAVLINYLDKYEREKLKSRVL